jgi:hypothetical protein
MIIQTSPLGLSNDTIHLSGLLGFHMIKIFLVQEAFDAGLSPLSGFSLQKRGQITKEKIPGFLSGAQCLRSTLKYDGSF